MSQFQIAALSHYSLQRSQKLLEKVRDCLSVPTCRKHCILQTSTWNWFSYASSTAR